MWQRTNLEYLLVKQPKLANVVTALVSRDVNNKIFSMTTRMEQRTGLVVDIRLPPFLSKMMDIHGELPSVYKTILKTRDQARDTCAVETREVKLTRDRSRRLVDRNSYREYVNVVNNETTETDSNPGDTTVVNGDTSRVNDAPMLTLATQKL